MTREQHQALALHAKLLTAQQSVDAVVKRGKNTDQKYSYATAADVIDVSRKALHGAGLVSAVADVFGIERREFTAKSGTKGLYVDLHVALRITDPDSGESAEFIAAGGGGDYGAGDKSILKAQTAATKYAYANALALPFADHDPEKDLPGEAGRLPKQAADPATALPDEKVDEIGAAVKAAGIDFERLCLIFGAVGGEAPAIKRKDSIRKAVASLTDGQAEHLLSSLEGQAASNA